MSHHRFALAWATCLVSLAAGCSGCTDRTEMDAGESDEEISEPDEEIPGILGTDDLVARADPMIGEKDEADRYSAAVIVAARRPPDEPRRYRDCSGVLIASNLALTAAHCMCDRPSRGEAVRFDRSRCATKADVRISEFTPMVG